MPMLLIRKLEAFGPLPDRDKRASSRPSGARDG